MSHQAAPPCPSWCQVHDNPTRWDTQTQAATDKTCAVMIDTDGIYLRLERYAAIEDGGLVVGEPAVRLEASGSMPLITALYLADNLLTAVHLARLPAVAGQQQ